MTSTNSVKSEPKVACRYCGYWDTPKFCSQCGAPLDNISPPTLLQYIWYRLSAVIEYIPRLALTWFLLSVHPSRFFKTLNSEGIGIHEIPLFLMKGKRREFRRSRLPIAAQGYFFVVVLVLTSLDIFGVKSAEDNLKGSRFSHLPFGLGDHVAVALPPVIMEVILVLLVFGAYRLYRQLLRKDNSPQLMEYFLYTSSHVVICVLLVVGLVEAIAADGFLSDIMFLLGFFVLSMFYFLGIPLHLASEPFLSLPRSSIIFAYCIMLIFLGLSLYVMALVGKAFSDSLMGDICWMMGC